MARTKRRRASPWLVFSALCFSALVALAVSSMSAAGAADSVVPWPRGQPPTEGIEEQEFEGCRFPAVDWDYWKSVNPDVAAWVTVPGTAIDYAVVQAPAGDPTFYLSHDIYRDWNPYGCPYIDADCDGFSGLNTVVFGHNMGFDSSMFGDFAKYSDAAFASGHREALVQTPDGKAVLMVAAVAVVEGSERSKRTDFADAGDFRAWYADRLADAATIIDGSDPERTVTFATCSYNYFGNERTLVYSIPGKERNTLWKKD